MLAIFSYEYSWFWFMLPSLVVVLCMSGGFYEDD